MTTKALFVRLEAKPGKEDQVAKFLRDGQALVQQEPATVGESCQGANAECARAIGEAAED